MTKVMRMNNQIKCLLISCLLILCFAQTAYCDDHALQMYTQQLDSPDEVLVQVVATKPLKLEAFTFSIVYDHQVYKLYKGYDVIPGGYGYGEEFATDNTGQMLMCNALDDRVIFSGIIQSEEQYVQGVIAQVVLLNYQMSKVEEEDIRLVISSVSIADGGKWETENPSQTQVPDGGQNLSDSVLHGGQSGWIQEPEDGLTKKDSLMGDIAGESYDGQTGTISPVPSEQEVSSSGVTSNGVDVTMLQPSQTADKADHKTKEIQNKSKKGLSKSNMLKWTGMVVPVIFVWGIAVLLYLKKKKWRD